MLVIIFPETATGGIKFQKKQIPNSKKKIKYNASIGELNP
jgi:hypothetical protein